MRFIFLFIFIAVFAAPVFGEDDLSGQFLEKASKYYLLKDYDKAILHLNFIFKLQPEDQMPQDAVSLANSVYYDAVKSIMSGKNYSKLDDLEIAVASHPAAFDDKVKTILKQARKQQEEEKLMSQKESERLERLEQEARLIAEREVERKLKQEEELKRIQADFELRKKEKEDYMKMQEKIRLDNNEQEERSRREMNQIINKIIEIQKSPQEKDAITQYLPVIIISVVSLLFLSTFIFILMVFMRHMKKEQTAMDYTLRAIIQLPEYQLADNGEKKQLGRFKPLALSNPKNEADKAGSGLPSEQNQFERMLEMCRDYGGQIDKLTHRKNTSRNVAETVYKISKFLNYDENEAMLHYTVSLIHDIGFLNIDSNLFQLKTLTPGQFEQVKTHVTEGLKMIGFVPEEYRTLFNDGISHHHENLDGSGYPGGLAGDNIPFIARVIRVAESYIALSSQRAYRDMKTSEAAVDILRQETDKYDEAIIDALDNIL